MYVNEVVNRNNTAGTNSFLIIVYSCSTQVLVVIIIFTNKYLHMDAGSGSKTGIRRVLGSVHGPVSID